VKRGDSGPTGEKLMRIFLPEGILPEAILPEGILPEGILPEGILPEAMGWSFPAKRRAPSAPLNLHRYGNAARTHHDA
jgi:hypothetical protein